MIVTKKEAIRELRTELHQILDGLWRITESGGQILRDETPSEAYRIAVLVTAINCLEDALQEVGENDGR
jgi:hypothetical protein